jgi:hypothetical protein
MKSPLQLAAAADDVATAAPLAGSSANAPLPGSPSSASFHVLDNFPNALFPCKNDDGNVTLKCLTSVSRVQGTPEIFSVVVENEDQPRTVSFVDLEDIAKLAARQVNLKLPLSITRNKKSIAPFIKEQLKSGQEGSVSTILNINQVKLGHLAGIKSGGSERCSEVFSGTIPELQLVLHKCGFFLKRM